MRLLGLAGRGGHLKRVSQQLKGKRHSVAGFTFMEVMIVVVLFAVIGVSLFQSLAMGMRVWKRSASFNVGERKALLGIERLSTDLRRVVNYASIGFTGERHSLSFANIVGDKIYNISYSYNDSDQGVYRYAVSKQEMLENRQSPQGRKVMENVKNFELGYAVSGDEARSFVFIDSWNATRGGLTPAVNISVELQDGKEIQKIVEIPIAQ